ncbi:MAG: hypothetical protein RJQ08_10895 [Salinisphaeraceae bacterium]
MFERLLFITPALSRDKLVVRFLITAVVFVAVAHLVTLETFPWVLKISLSLVLGGLGLFAAWLVPFGKQAALRRERDAWDSVTRLD